MSKTIIFLAFFGLLVGPLACKDAEPSVPASSFSNAPESLASEDMKSGGVYKGTFVGSSGSLKVTLQKGVKSATITLDGVTKTLATTSLDGWTSGELIRQAIFQTSDSDPLQIWQMHFGVAPNGATPSASLTIPGHPNIEIALVKEISTEVVRVFEGTYVGSETGSWNFIVQGVICKGLSRSSDGSTINTIDGLVNGNTISFVTIQATGTINGDQVSGMWQGSSADFKGTWEGKRTM